MAWKGNPNSSTNQTPPNPKQFGGERSNSKIKHDRSKDIRRDTDNFKNVSITLEDIDTTLFKFIDEKLNLQVMDNGELVKVPVIYGSPESWTSIKKGASIRDNNGKLQLPAFMFSRTSFTNNRDLETFNRYLKYDVVSQYTEKNKYTRFDILNHIQPVKQIYSVTLPKHIKVTYECLIWTDFVDQNNKLIEKINFAEKDYWGDPDRLKFRVNINDFSNEVENPDDGDRNVLTTFNLEVYAYLLSPDMVPSMDGIKSTSDKKFTPKKVTVSEHVVSGYQLDSIKKTNTYYSSNKSDIVNNYQYDGNYVVKRDPRAIQSELITESGNITIYKTPFHPAPATSTEYGESGWVAYDKDYFYIYAFPKGWLRRSIATFDYDPSSDQYISGYDCNNDPIYTTRSARPLNTAFRIFTRFPDKFYQQVPVQSEDYGEDGWVSYDGNYFYIYSDNAWRRIVTTLFEQF
jgi:hypothetical protein